MKIFINKILKLINYENYINLKIKPSISKYGLYCL